MAKDLDIQREWDDVALRESWPGNRDHAFVMRRIATVPVDETALGAAGHVLEVAAAEAVHSCRLSRRGLQSVVLEPSPAMLARARARAHELGARLTLVRGIAETLPFRDGIFERVLCESAVDHLQNPDAGVREMARVLRPEGRLVLSFVNYGGLSPLLSRLVYRIVRRGAPVVPGHHRFWDSPVPIEHTFEATLPVVRRLCEPYLELDRVVGVSLGWGVPGWPGLLRRLSPTAAERVLATLDRWAQRVPSMADYVLTVWRPRRDRPRGAGTMHVQPSDPAYQWRAAVEAARSPLLAYVERDPDTAAVARRIVNTAITGDPGRSWLDDLSGRGPFADAAMLGCESADHLAAWVRSGASRRLDVYEPGRETIRKLRAVVRRARAGASAPTDVRFVRTDLNFVALPAERYDVIWSSGALSRVVNLERLLAEIEGALRPRGLFAVHDYVGERRLQYDPARLARVNAVLETVPVRFRVSGETPLAPAPLSLLTPLCAVRSDEVLPLAGARFETVHQRLTGALFPLFLAVDLGRLAREAPDVLRRLVAAEEDAARDPGARPCAGYVVFQRRGIVA